LILCKDGVRRIFGQGLSSRASGSSGPDETN
jgi:hypothetical protein